MFANTQLVEAAGLKLPTEAESATFTWDQVVELARKLTKPDGSQYGLHIESFESVPYSGNAYDVNDPPQADPRGD